MRTLPDGFRGSASTNVISLGDLEARQLGLAVRNELVRRGARVLAQHHEGHGDFAPPVVRTADHGRLEDRVVLVEHALDLRAGDVLSPRHDHVLEAVDDVQVPVCVADADVPGVEPAPRERRSRRIARPASTP